jgi:hydrophobic/amphiphilic exporter-1 (mainly G- bacteria), HAE1 family
MAITVIGGLLTSTLLTLVVIPVVYSLLDRKKRPVPDVSGTLLTEGR